MHRSSSAGDNSHVIHSQSIQSKKLNFFTWPDLTFSFVNKRSGYEIIKTCKLVAIMLCQQVTQKHKKEHYLHSFQDYGFYAYKLTYYILSQTFSTLWEKFREAQSYKNLWNTGCPAFKSLSEWNNYKWLARLRKLPILIIYHKNPTR